MNATEFLKDPSKHAPGPMVVLYGPQLHLKRSAFAAIAREILGNEDDLALVKFDGKTADWKSVSDELLTVSMWGDRRLVAIEDADDFVTKNRPALEKYLEKPSKK